MKQKNEWIDREDRNKFEVHIVACCLLANTNSFFFSWTIMKPCKKGYKANNKTRVWANKYIFQIVSLVY